MPYVYLFTHYSPYLMSFYFSYHYPFIGLFNPTLTPEVKAYVTANYLKKVAYVNDVLLNGKDYLVGSGFTIADSYLYITFTWCAYVGVDISAYKNVVAYVQRIKSLPMVAESHALIATSPSKTA